MGSSSARALDLYRRILRAARQFEAAEDRSYIRHEAGRLFRENAGVSDPNELRIKMFEAESRLEIGTHYKIPYPRPFNVVPGATGKSREAVQPGYMFSDQSTGEHGDAGVNKLRRPVFREEE